MWFATISGLYPRHTAHDPVPGRLRAAAMLAWFTWFASWGLMLYDLVGLPLRAIFGGAELVLDVDHVEAVLPGWILQLTLHFLLCLGLHGAQVVYAMSLPFPKLPAIVALRRSHDTTPTKPELLAMLLDQEAEAGGFQLATVHAFVHHADLQAWSTRKRVLTAWLRLQLTRLDAEVRGGHDIIEFEGRRERVQDLSMRMHTVVQLLRKPSPAES